MAVTTYTKTGTKAATPAKLDKSIFGLEVKNHELLKQAYVAYLSNGRTNNAVSLKRGEVSGGGRKPWKQKGTGRARFGSTRNPIWRGGGIAFGPTGVENYTKKLPTNAKRTAIRQALSLAVKADKVVIIEALDAKNAKTSESAKLLAKMNATKRTLIVVDTKTVELTRSVANLEAVKVVQASYLNVFDVLNADTVLIISAALPLITEWLGEKK